MSIQYPTIPNDPSFILSAHMYEKDILSPGGSQDALSPHVVVSVIHLRHEHEDPHMPNG